MTEPQIDIRPARTSDVPAMLDLINYLAAEGVMLPRSPASVVEGLRDFVVVQVDGEFAGCGALAIVWTDLAEIRSIAVEKRFQKLGLGRLLAERLLDDAEGLHLARVMAFTYVTGFFEKLGFRVVEHSSLPHKVFNDCLNCPKFHKCDEVAVLKDLKSAGDSPPLGSEVGPLSLPIPGRSLPRG